MKKFNPIIIIIILILILGTLIYLVVNTSNNGNKQNINQMEKPGSTNGSSTNSSSVETLGALSITEAKEITSGTYESTTANEAPIVVSNGGNLTISKSTINKSSGDSTNTENSDFYGVNAGILTKSNSATTIKNCVLKTSAKGANAVFVTGTDSKVYISDSEITTTGSSSSRGLDATYGGYIEADNVKITTQGGSCATLATDRGEGTITAKNMNLETNGAGSPLIYSTGNITLSDSTGVSNGSQNVVVEGKNSATVTNSKLTSSGKGNRNDVDNCSVMIYQSMSGDAGTGTGTFSAKNSTLSISSSSSYYKSAPFFFVTNADAIINLEDCTLNYGSNILLSAKGTSEWGNSSSNGGNVVLNATNQDLVGDIQLDSISTLKLNLDSSKYKGTINGDNTAKSISITLDSASTITLTGNSYITSLNDKDSTYSNINFNGYKLYVNGNSIK